MNNIFCIVDTILEPDVYDIETIDNPPYTLIRIWEDSSGKIRKMSVVRLYPGTELFNNYY